LPDTVSASASHRIRQARAGDRFLWLQDFAARLQELGVPASSMQLLTLGRTLCESSKRTDPRSTADAVLARWPNL
jgi:hypothetical protein